MGQSDQAGRLASSSGAAGRMSSHHPSQYGAENKFQVQSYKLLPPSVRPESGHIKALQPIISVPSDLALPDQNSTLRLMGPNPAAGFTQTPADFLSGLGSSYAAAGALQQPSSSLPPLAHHHQLQQPSAASLLSNLLSSGAGQQQHHMAGMQAAAEVAAAAAAAHHQQQLQGAAAAAADHDLRGLLADPAHLELLSALLQTPFFFPGASTEQALQQIMQPAGGAAGAAAAAAPGPSGAAATIAVPAGHMAAGAAAVQAVPGEGTPLAARPPSRSAFDAAPQGGMTPSAFFV